MFLWLESLEIRLFQKTQCKNLLINYCHIVSSHFVLNWPFFLVWNFRQSRGQCFFVIQKSWVYTSWESHDWVRRIPISLSALHHLWPPHWKQRKDNFSAEKAESLLCEGQYWQLSKNLEAMAHLQIMYIYLHEFYFD